MPDISDKSEQQSLQKLEAQQGGERERLKQTLEKAEEARPHEPSSREIEQFRQNFGDKNGTDHVIEDARHDDPRKRFGADHQMRVAQELDGKVRSFEEPIHPERTGQTNQIDIVTTDDYAVECKALRDKAEPSYVADAYRQAETRLEPNTEGKTFKGVVVVFSDGKLTGEAAQESQRYEANNPQIRFCEKSQVNQVLDEMRARTGKR